jgi:hypothetical protein
MRIRPVEQVVDRDPVADERARALLLRVQAAKPLVARLSQGDASGRRESRRRVDGAKARGNDDERGSVVASLACALERLLEHRQDSVIGSRMGQRVSCAGGLASISSIPAVASLRMDPADRVASGKVEERDLAVAVDLGQDVARSTRHASRMWRGSPTLRRFLRGSQRGAA